MTPISASQSCLPPSYSEQTDEITAPPLVTNTDTLPAYSASNRSSGSLSITIRPLSPNAPLKEFHTQTKLDKKGKSIAVLAVCGDKGLSKTFPTLVEGQVLRGTAKIVLEKPKGFSRFVVYVRGQIITSSVPGEEFSFVDIPSVLWSQDMGDPRTIATRYIPLEEDLNPISHSSSGTSTASSQSRTSEASGSSSSCRSGPDTPNSNIAFTSPTKSKFSSKLQAGTYIFDFLFELPKQVSLPVWNGTSKDPVMYRLPQTFAEKHTRGNVVYLVELKLVKDGLLLKTDEKVTMQFGYIPVTFPPPFPPLRAMAYQEDTTLLGPAIDPEGWHALKPVKVRGRLFSNRMVEVECILYLAKPLAYTRTSVIPLFLHIGSTDIQALDLLSSPKAIVCRLQRTINYDYHPEWPSFGNTIDYSPLAVWSEKGWGMSGAQEASQDPQKRCLHGELHLNRNIKPSSAMAHFRIEYAVALFSFDTAGFEKENSSGEGVIAEQTVEVVTAFAPGPRPRKSAPPGYADEGWIKISNHEMARGLPHFL